MHYRVEWSGRREKGVSVVFLLLLTISNLDYGLPIVCMW